MTNNNQNKSTTQIDDLPELRGTPQAEFLKRISKYGEDCPKEYFWLEFRRYHGIKDELKQDEQQNVKQNINEIEMSNKEIVEWVKQFNPDMALYVEKRINNKPEPRILDWNNLRDVSDEDINNLQKLNDIQFLVQEKK